MEHVCASREAAVKLKTILTWAAIAFVLWWVIQQPTSAAHLVHNIGRCSAKPPTVCRVSWRASEDFSNGH